MDKRRYILSVLLEPGIIVVFAAKLLDYRKFAKILMTSSFPVLFDFN
jgi:hypothetical protein